MMKNGKAKGDQKTLQELCEGAGPWDTRHRQRNRRAFVSLIRKIVKTLDKSHWSGQLGREDRWCWWGAVEKGKEKHQVGSPNRALLLPFPGIEQEYSERELEEEIRTYPLLLLLSMLRKRIGLDNTMRREAPKNQIQQALMRGEPEEKHSLMTE